MVVVSSAVTTALMTLAPTARVTGLVSAGWLSSPSLNATVAPECVGVAVTVVSVTAFPTVAV